MHLRRILIACICTLILNHTQAQIFGGDPPSMRWKQINTPQSRVIFPPGLDSVARRITNIISFIRVPTLKTIGNHSKKINIVLQNQTVVSNAYVALGPFRSEFYMTPQQNSFDMGSIPWPDQLTIHEYRHVEQYNNFDVGLSRLMGTLFGQEGVALANNAAIPNWFYEGDAVFNETNLSRQGRGNLPAFFDAYRSLWKAGKNYSWMKLRNGSLKDFVPDHYALGYLLVAYGRQTYGDDFWKNVTHDAASYKNLIYPFQHALKKYSGVDYVTFRNDAFDFFKTQFSEVTSSSDSLLGKFKNEQFPSFAGDGSIIFLRSTSRQAPQFVIERDNSLKKIRTQDFTLDDYFSYRKGKIVYTSYQPDMRWGYRDYSNLEVINVATGKEQTLSKKRKYFSPDISEDGTTIVVVNETSNGQNNLRLLNAQTGKLIREIPNRLNLFYTYPKFYGQKIITPVRNAEGKMSIAQIDLSNNVTSYLLPFSFNVAGFPLVHNDTLYFSYSMKENDDLFAYTFADKKIWRLEVGHSIGIGRYQPFVNDHFIGWTSFTAEGYRIEKAAKSSVTFKEISPADLQQKPSDFGVDVIGKTNANLLAKVPNDSFKIARYRKSFKLINFHSIEPAINDPTYTLNLVSENILNTLQSDVSFTYDRAEKYKEVSLNATYGGWFPYLTAGINYFIDRSTLFRSELVHFNQMEPYGGFNIPLNLSAGRSLTYLNFGSQYVYSQGTFRGKYRDSLSSTYSYVSNFLSLSHEIQKAPQQIFPSFAQSVSLSYKTGVFAVSGSQFMANGNLYFPGFSKTHSLVVNGALLRKDSMNQISFTSGFPFSRGYQSVNFYQMYKWGINYHFPIAFPDKGFGDIAYLVRVRANLFYDDTEVNDFDSNRRPFSAAFRSAGTEITFDTKWWNEVNVSFGIRYSRLLDKDTFGGAPYDRWEIILPVNILHQ